MGLVARIFKPVQGMDLLAMRAQSATWSLSAGDAMWPAVLDGQIWVFKSVVDYGTACITYLVYARFVLGLAL